MYRRWLRKLWRSSAASPDSASQLPETCKSIEFEIDGVQALDRGFLQAAAKDTSSDRHLSVAGAYDAKSPENTIDHRWLAKNIGEAVLDGLVIVKWKFKGCGCVYESLHRVVDGENRFKDSVVLSFNHNRPADVPLTDLSQFQSGLQKALQNQRVIGFSTKPKQTVSSWNPLRQRAKHQQAGRNEGKQKLARQVEPSWGPKVEHCGLGDWEMVKTIPLPGVIDARHRVIEKVASHSGVKSTLDQGEDLNITGDPLVSGKDALLTQGPDNAKSDVKERGEDAGQADLEPAAHSMPGDSPTREYVEGPYNPSSVVQPSIAIRPPSHEEHRSAPAVGVLEPNPHHPEDVGSPPGGLETRGHRRGQASSQDSSGITLWSSLSSDTHQTTRQTSMITSATTASQPTVGGRSPPMDTTQFPSVYQDPRPSVLEECDEQGEETTFPPIDTISSASSSHSNLEYPDNYWTYDPESGRDYHIEENQDGSKKIYWYPEEFM